MKRFSDIEPKFENKKFQEKSKNDIYSMIKENIFLDVKGVDNVSVNLMGIETAVQKIDEYITTTKIQEKKNTLELIKAFAATGTLNMGRINEEIESCKCSETCPEKFSGDEKENESESDFDPGYYEDEADESEDEIIDTQNESMISEGIFSKADGNELAEWVLNQAPDKNITESVGLYKIVIDSVSYEFISELGFCIMNVTQLEKKNYLLKPTSPTSRYMTYKISCKYYRTIKQLFKDSETNRKTDFLRQFGIEQK